MESALTLATGTVTQARRIRDRRTSERVFWLHTTTNYASLIQRAHEENQHELKQTLFKQRLIKSQPQEAIHEVAQCSETLDLDELPGHKSARG